MANPIIRLQLTGFRGSTTTFDLAFDPQKDLTMLFGENGSGKSTILDAIDVVCNGTVGCLDGVSVGPAAGKYLCTLGCQPASMQVVVSTAAESWTGTMRRNAISVTGGVQKPSVKILRRNEILRLVLAQPAERYRALQRFVDTHYRLWWDRSQNANGTQRVHLGKWTAASGIAAQSMPAVTQSLRALIASPVLDRQAVSSKAGILLESLLDDLATHFGCSLPRNRLNEYTLGALVNGCKKLFTRHSLSVQINAHWNADGQPEAWQPSDSLSPFNRVEALQFIRNQVGCHFNPPGMDIPDDDVREFGQATVALFEALTCPNCGMLPSKVANEGTHLRCSCPKRAARLTPVAIQ